MLDIFKVDLDSRVPKYQQIVESVINGITNRYLSIDQKIPSISAASIIAKVTRDKFITKLSKKFKNYGWETNFGYGTKKHLNAINKFGVTIHHRKSFKPMHNILLGKKK